VRFQKIKLSQEAHNRLRLLKGNTGLTPNILCRFAFAHSIENRQPLSTEEYDTDGQELNRPTLMGDHDDIIVGLLRERCLQDGVPVDDDAVLLQHLVGHINRGVMSMSSSIKALEDLVRMAPKV
jgi:DNA sulfur modification protein DndE